MALRQTVFHGDHIQAGARMVDFGGWHMPIQYSGIIAEHVGVRRGVGLFDVSHMGEVRVRGERAEEALNALLTNDVSALPPGTSHYSAMLNERGGFVDDVYVYRLAADDFLVCVNASNRDKDFAWMVEHNPLAGEVDFVDEGDSWAQIALQGRHAVSVASELTELDLAPLARGAVVFGDFAGVEGCWIARTGYTGEDGFEVFMPVEQAQPAWARIVEAGADHDLVLVGLGARDTLRLEAGNVLYGNEIGEDTTPLEAGLRWITKLDKGDFVGRDALIRQREAGISRRLVGLEIEGRIGRPHQPILIDGEPVGELTSGTRSPWMGTNIALGYVRQGHGRPGTNLDIDVRGRIAHATVVKPPFFQREY
ncbi:MAG: glycine cleavage system aminomethyltransferase GcvT [Myxococcota bacterium]|nr:glycine cleavage system aminomethyltransferase GcvT [Myxococcota bacterium]